ncbi:MAG: hypothetical protein EOP48_33435 [Sphingobacteriales bacterium]|nr:MAG: hypothetical protein EOP48_33435 [Sphingobacteriales bacterium]
MPSLSPANYANFRYGSTNVSFPRVNYQVGSFGANSLMLQFRKGGFDSGSISITNPNQLNSLLNNIGTRLNITGVLELFGDAVKEEANAN